MKLIVNLFRLSRNPLYYLIGYKFMKKYPTLVAKVTICPLSLVKAFFGYVHLAWKYKRQSFSPTEVVKPLRLPLQRLGIRETTLTARERRRREKGGAS